MLILTLISAALAGDLTTVGGENLDSDEHLDVSAAAGDAIINGESATADDYPMTGGMLMRADIEIWGSTSSVSTIVCSSTLIAPDVVLLAAHCLDDYALTYGMGEVNNKELQWSRQADLTAWDGSGANPDWPADAVAVIDTVMHEDFDLTTMAVGIAENDDIALMFLAEAVTDVEPAYLPTLDEATQLEEGLEVAVVGWGQQSAGDPDDIGEKRMGDSVVGELGSAEFLVGPEASDVRQCHGDSGGPVFLDVDADTETPTRIVGVTSHAYDETACASIGAVNTRVDAHLDWLDAQLRARCEDGFRVWCEEPGLIFAPMVEEEDNDGGVGDGLGPGSSTGDGSPTELTTDAAGCSTVSGPMLWWLPVLLGRRRRPARSQTGGDHADSSAAQP